MSTLLTPHFHIHISSIHCLGLKLESRRTKVLGTLYDVRDCLLRGHRVVTRIQSLFEELTLQRLFFFTTYKFHYLQG